MNTNFFVQRDFCPACKSTRTKELYSSSFTEPPISTYLHEFYSDQGGVEFDYLKDVNFTLVECRECGLVYQQLIPNDFLMTKLYEEWIDPHRVCETYVRGLGVEYYSELAREMEMLIRHFGKVPCELDLFDFGMGWGDWCLMAKVYGCSSFGSELSQARIDYAKKSGVSIITWEEIPEYKFDFINTEQVFEHIANPLETLQYLRQSLKTNGIIKISVPNGWDIKRRLTNFDWKSPKESYNSLNPVAPLEHINCFSQDSLMRMAEKADLVPVQIRANIPFDRMILDLTIRDILRPFYKWILKAKSHLDVGSTCIFFQKSAV